MKRRIAIIGAGVSGLPAIKCCLDEDLEPVCFERSGDIGGIWNYEESLRTSNMTSVTRFTIANSSKEMSCYSDLPFPKEYPLFPPHNLMQSYLKLYAENFDLLKHVHLHSEVTKVQRTADFTETGHWLVRWKNTKTGEEKQEDFNGVMMCTGRFNERRIVTFEGQEIFKGRILHSREYKSHEGFVNKKIVVVGLKNTGADIAVELSGHGSQVYASSRKGIWSGGRLMRGNTPPDCASNSRLVFGIFNLLPTKLAGKLIRRAINARFDHGRFGLEPNYVPGLVTGQFVINDLLPERIISGKVIIKPNIRRFTETSVVFEDSSVVENVDVVILATGYELQLPYLDCSEFTIERDNIDLYKHIFAPDVKPSTIALIGCIGATAGIMPLAEMQCRVAIRVLKGDVSLPSEFEMRLAIRKHRDAIDKKRRILGFNDPYASYMTSPYVQYMTDLSEICGCRPTFFKLLKMDTRLAWQYLFGPAVPAQFRLCGHGAWSGAKQTILSAPERAAYPYRNHFKTSHNISEKSSCIKCLLLALISILIYYLFF